MRPWIGVDLDGTLAVHHSPYVPTEVGAPIAPMVTKVRNMIEAGLDVRIFTARVAPPVEHREKLAIIAAIHDWCWQHLHKVLLVTCVKDAGLIALFDDRAVSVQHNTGMTVSANVLPQAIHDAMHNITKEEDREQQ